MNESPTPRKRTDAYGVVLTALAFNAPLYLALLSRDLVEVPSTGLTHFYAGLVFVGYYGLLLLLLVSGIFWATAFSTRLALFAAAATLGSAVLYLVIDSTVYEIYRFHVDAFWVSYAATNYTGLGIPSSLLTTGVVVLLVVVAGEVGILQLARRYRRGRRFHAGLVAAILTAFVLSQTIHVAAYQNNDARITSITPNLPYYYPIHSSKHAAQYGHLVPLLTPGGAHAADVPTTLHYPLTRVECRAPTKEARRSILILLLESWRYDTMNAAVSPNMFALSQRSISFDQHFSSGNATPHGVFGLFYGIHPTYWTAVKANSAAIHNPLLIDLLESNGYAFGIFADSHFDRHKIKETMFAGITVHESFSGRTAAAKDDDMTDDLIDFVREQKRNDTPFLGLAFYKSTHHSYDYPETEATYQPARDLNIARLNKDEDPTPYLNDYRNAVAHVDRLIGRVIEYLDDSGALDDTIVIVTSDHGEEFNDNGTNYWGHTSNFTQFQTQVPMIVYAPGRKPRHVAHATSHTDVPVTLLEEALECEADARGYSNGRNLFGPQNEPRPIVVGGYESHAFIIGDNVYAAYPVRTRAYRLSDIEADPDPPDPDLMKQALEGTSRFFRSSSR